MGKYLDMLKKFTPTSHEFNEVNEKIVQHDESSPNTATNKGQAAQRPDPDKSFFVATGELETSSSAVNSLNSLNSSSSARKKKLPRGPIPPLPWQLERLLNAASSGVLNVEVADRGDVSHHVMAWGCSYLAGDREESLKRLWEVYNLWQPNKKRKSKFLR